MSLRIQGLATAFPDKVIDNTFFGEAVAHTKNVMFLGTEYRRHVDRHEKASDLISRAARTLLQELALDPEQDVDMILTNVSVPDELFTGCGAVVNKNIGGRARWIYDLHNTGCVSFLYLLDLAQSMMESKGARSALICTAQTAGGRIFSLQDTRKKPQSAIPGDGCGVAYITRESQSQILGSILENFSEYSEDMFMSYDDGRKYWEPGSAEGYIDFNEAKTAKVITRGNRLVPEMVKKVCAGAGIKTREIDVLITNQPNLHFLRNWREALQLREDQHFHTFPQYANLFGAGIPITLAEALKEGRIRPGHLVCLAGFSHAGDYAGATLLRW